MTEIKKIVSYVCDFCEKKSKQREDFIEISGQYYGRSDMPYCYHFCNIKCLKSEIKRIKNPATVDYDYLDILEHRLIKENFKDKK